MELGGEEKFRVSELGRRMRKMGRGKKFWICRWTFLNNRKKKNCDWFRRVWKKRGRGGEGAL